MIEATCHCGAIHLAIDHAPDEVTDCNCSICHRYGVLWAYYSPRQVRQTTGIGETEAYLWGERSIVPGNRRVRSKTRIVDRSVGQEDRKSQRTKSTTGRSL